MSNINALADRYAAAKAVADAAAAEVKALADEIKALGQEQIEGSRCFLKIGLSERSTLDTKAVKAELGEQWVKDHSKVTLVTSLTIKAKPVGTLVAKALQNVA